MSSDFKLQDGAKQSVQKVIDNFKSGNIPEVLSNVFVRRRDDLPSNNWSINNRLIMLLHGTSDARSFNAWKKVGRCVSGKGKQFYILKPLKKRFENDEGEIITFIWGFAGTPEYKIEDTIIIDEDKWLSCTDKDEEERLKNLPLREVADEWNLFVESYNGKDMKALGYYRLGEKIALGVKNLSTWTHELVHAADHRLGTLNMSKGSHEDNEIVAELGGATILCMLGMRHDADLGGAWSYINRYSNTPIRTMMSLINRVGNCVDLILKTGEKYVSEYTE